MSPAHLPAPARAALLAASALLAAACDGETSTSTRDRADTGAADAKADAPADARDAA
ncbi:MAG: DUF4349 domain-containing protein, partial [Polyangiaceae bacterium]|nr:DUF4349 domain-containing protein [Polyangiaceae bacterium]